MPPFLWLASLGDEQRYRDEDGKRRRFQNLSACISNYVEECLQEIEEPAPSANDIVALLRMQDEPRCYHQAMLLPREAREQYHFWQTHLAPSRGGSLSLDGQALLWDILQAYPLCGPTTIGTVRCGFSTWLCGGAGGRPL